MTRLEILYFSVSTFSALSHNAAETYRSQNRIHELIEVVSIHQSSAFENAHCQLWYHGQVALEVLTDDFTHLVVILQGLDLLDLSEGVESIVV